ncbi:zinc ribbon domain-containing protein, partial [Brotaphodocola sp.]|uniref:zinc ribbon domain-containing protein n=1 Tax=Brotaphodocola sp. TaxID=3073577 RepID=UPI003D7D0BC0
REIIQYLCEWNGIRCIEQEESYTSKASFPDHDPIPVYQKEDSTKYTFSGKRKPTRYAGIYKKDGFRGLYQTKNGMIINSDLNGSANILRKAYPQAFTGESLPCFENVFIIFHPDYENQKRNREKQLQANHLPSKSKQKRQRRKEHTFRQTVA